MRAETKLWHNLKKATPQIKWTRLESSASLGLPDLLGYNKNNVFFTVELKIIYANKIHFSPHQIAFHIRHTKNTFIVAGAQAPSSVKLFPGAMILELRKVLVGGSHPYFFIFFRACGLAASVPVAWLFILGRWSSDLKGPSSWRNSVFFICIFLIF